MSILQLTLSPDPLLRKRLADISDFEDPWFRDLVASMRTTMVAAQGIGLAANQVGQDVQVFTIDAKLAKKSGISDVFVNPVLERASVKTVIMEEGCLSLPGKFEDVRRPAEVVVSAQDEHGKPFRVDATGLLARVLQHEYDHLNGTLYIDRL